MKLEEMCVKCLRDKEIDRAQKILDDFKKQEYIVKVDEILSSDDYLSPPEYLDAFTKVYPEEYKENVSFVELKEKYNQFLLNQEECITKMIEEANDPLETAIKAAQAGNYIDFIAMKNIDEEKLNELLGSFDSKKIDQDVYKAFVNDLSNAKKLVYTLDNCGEIVIDKILIKLLQKMYPQLEISVIVRGTEIGNDVTMKDAADVGLDQVTYVLDNGTTIAGTSIHRMKKEAVEIVEQADIIISKGQANFETLHGTGKNIYFMFLCKCNFFMKMFDAEYLDPIFYRETISNH